MKLADKVAIVTGAASGIGKAIALGYAREGANVVVNDINLQGAKLVAREIESLGRKAIAIKADVSKASEVKAMVEETLSEFQKIDILVNNAGIVTRESFLNTKEENWDKVINVNLKGVFLCSQLVAREMIQRRIKGRIINIASILGRMAHLGVCPAYCASKAGVISLTQYMAVELAPYGINVNAIAPGSILTGMTEARLSDPIIKERRIQRIPLGRIGMPEDIVGVAIFLASNDSDYITGEVIVVDGGIMAHVAM